MTKHFNPSHRRQAIQWARNLLQRGFFVLDTETTGLGNNDEIVQIALVKADGTAAMNQLVRPSVPIPAGASRVHGISDADVADSPIFSGLYITLSSMLAGETIIAYNMDFDWRLLRQTCATYRLPNIRVAKRDCAMKQYAKFKGKRDSYGRGYVWHKLVKAAAQEGVAVLDAHDALGDAVMTLELIKKMAEAD